MLGAEDIRVEDAGRGRERIDGGVDAELGDLPREDRGRVQVRERGGRRRVCDVIRWNVDRLHRRDRSVLGRCDPLLQIAHLRRQCRLITDSARHAAE